MFQKTASVTETKPPRFTSSHELLYACAHDETTWNLYMRERLRCGFQWYYVYSREQFQPEGITRASGSATGKHNIARNTIDVIHWNWCAESHTFVTAVVEKTR